MVVEAEVEEVFLVSVSLPSATDHTSQSTILKIEFILGCLISEDDPRKVCVCVCVYFEVSIKYVRILFQL